MSAAVTNDANMDAAVNSAFVPAVSIDCIADIKFIGDCRVDIKHPGINHDTFQRIRHVHVPLGMANKHRMKGVKEPITTEPSLRNRW